MPGLRQMDAFRKTRPELRSHSPWGGAVTLLAASVAALLFLSQVLLYAIGGNDHSLHLAQSLSIPLLPLEQSHMAVQLMSRAGKIPLDLHVSFPHVPCNQLDVLHDGAAWSTGEFGKVHPKHSLQRRTPTASEWSKMGVRPSRNGCTIVGNWMIPIVAGNLEISLHPHTWTEATRLITTGMFFGTHDEQIKNELKAYNVSHYIHHMRFGRPFPKAQHWPLENRRHSIDSEWGGLSVEQVDVRLIPTVYTSLFGGRQHTYQMSVAEHSITAESLILRRDRYIPGLRVEYDFTPLAVHQSGGRDNFLVFLSSLVSIVGGTFVTVRLLTGCLVSSAQEIAKKLD